MYFVRQTWANSADKRNISSVSTLFATHPGILDTTVGSKLNLFKSKIKYDKELRCLNIKGKYGKVTNTEIKWSIISKSVTIIIFVVFIDQLIDYPINRASIKSISLFLYLRSLYITCHNMTTCMWYTPISLHI